VGDNGSGKTTLLRMLAGRLETKEGMIERVEGLKTVYFDQQREQLDPGVSLRRALAEKGDSVIYQGRPIHVIAWAKRFLFRVEQLEMPLGRLSGGEQAKVLIARLMLTPADLLLLDEPTNDLDIPTLEVLEESLVQFQGALVMVTHDRYLLDRVSTLLLGLDGRGGARYFADYHQWMTEGRPRSGSARERKPNTPNHRRARQKAPSLSYLEKREYEAMEENILRAEAELEGAKKNLDDPAIATDAVKLQESYETFDAAQNRVESLYARWEELEDKLQGRS